MKIAVRRSAALAATGVLAGVVLMPALPAAASITPGITAPGNLKVERTGADSTDLAITWKAVQGVDHYTVSVFDGSRDTATVLGSSATSFTHDGTGVCTRYRVRVSAVGADGAVATTNDFLVGSLAPGGPGVIKATRTESGGSGELAWAGATWTGAAPLAGYDVKVTNMGTGEVIEKSRVTSTGMALKGLDARRQYSVKVTPVNDFGSCTTGTTVLYGAQPSSPLGFTVTRDPAAPSKVIASWSAPQWSGYGPITGYELGFGDLRITKWVKLDGTSFDLDLDPDVQHVFAVRAISSDDKGNLSKTVKLARFVAPTKTVVDPQVTMTESSGTLTVDVAGPVGSHSSYPKMKVRVEPTLTAGTFRDEHVVANGAANVVFTQIPCGVYTVTVTGFGNGPQKEFARQIVNRCDTGLIAKDQWKLVYGKSTINGNSVSFPTAGENRVVSTVPRKTPDMVFTTTAHLTAGWGYGIWARADLSSGASVSGYSFQYDPGYANVNASFGKALLLRLWTNGRECGTPLARVPFPAGIDVYSPHRVVVTVKDDSLYATIDDKLVFNVESLKAAVAKNGCGMPVPTGTQVGFRTWNSTTASFTGTTLS